MSRLVRHAEILLKLLLWIIYKKDELRRWENDRRTKQEQERIEFEGRCNDMRFVHFDLAYNRALNVLDHVAIEQEKDRYEVSKWVE